MPARSEYVKEKMVIAMMRSNPYTPADYGKKELQVGAETATTAWPSAVGSMYVCAVCACVVVVGILIVGYIPHIHECVRACVY